MSDAIVIAGGSRTPFGSFMGELADVTAAQLGATAIAGALGSAKAQADIIDQVVMGVVLPAGVGQAPARQAAAGAGVPWSAVCSTVNKMCGSGMQAIIQGHDAIKAGSSSTVVAGGMESMTNTPHLMPMRSGRKPVDRQTIEDHMFFDGLRDSFDCGGGLMGEFAENTAARYQFSREAQDDFAIRSLKRAQSAGEAFLVDEIAPVTKSTRGGDVTIALDEQPRTARLDKIPLLKPAFRKDGSVTAANSSSISDGAAAVVLTTESAAARNGLTPAARIVAHASYSREPEWFTLAPIDAIRIVAEKAGWKLAEVDLFEINEAFAVVPMAATQELGLDAETVNIYGGACALGHPVGASGARIVWTLIRSLKEQGLKRGIAAICIGGGEATAVAVELI